MKIIKRIKAFFCKSNEPVELDLIAAEIKLGRAYLHTRGEEEKTYLVCSDDIRISLSEGKVLQDHEVISVVPKSSVSKKKTEEKHKAMQGTPGHKPAQVVTGQEMYKKRTFTVSLYPDEYDELINSMKEYGYKRADFVLACVQSARKTSIEKAHKQIVRIHKQKRKEQRDFLARSTTAQDGNSQTA